MKPCNERSNRIQHQHPLFRPIYLLLCLILLASCSLGPASQAGPDLSPTSIPPPAATSPGAPPTAQAAAPTAEPPATQPAAPTAAPPATQAAAPTAQTDTFVVPAKQSEALPPQALPDTSYAHPDVERELRAFFEQV